MRIEEHVLLSTLTTFRVGGPARYVVVVEDESELAEVVAFAKGKNLPIIPLGSGSNILAHDGAHDAVFVRLARTDIRVGGNKITAAAGALWDDVVVAAMNADLWGIENLSAIPGTVGGAVYQNIGAYGAALSETLESVRAFDLTEKQARVFSKSDCVLAYRTSLFKESQDQFIILEVTFALSSEPTPTIGYKDLQQRFAGIPKPTLTEIRDAVQKLRAAKFPPRTEFGTAGSFFLNPIVNKETAAQLQKEFKDMPVFPLPEGGIKIPLGWFFEHVLKLKGYREGNVEAWRNQALVLTAHEGATAGEIKMFAEKIIARADRELKIKITPEVRLL